MSTNYHWVCDRCARGREEKTLGWGAQVWGYCAECTESLSPSGRNAHYVAKKNSAMVRSGVSDAELRHALAHYSKEDSAATSGMMRAAGSAMPVHHTLPCMVVTGCGVLLSKLEKDYDRLGVRGESYSYDLSRTTCKACLKAATEAPKDVQQQAADATWLKEQSEDFASLKKLVEAVNRSGYVAPLSSEAKPYYKTRAEYVTKYMGDDLPNKPWSRPSEEDRDPTLAFPGGLCHDDAHKLIDSVRTGVEKLRAGQAWPDDARRVASDLESTVEALVGGGTDRALENILARKQRLVEELKNLSLCSGGCGGDLPESATPGGLCEKCMKAADGQRRR